MNNGFNSNAIVDERQATARVLDRLKRMGRALTLAAAVLAVCGLVLPGVARAQDGLMHPDATMLRQWNDAYANAPRTQAKADLGIPSATPTSFSLMGFSPWNASNLSQRDQGACGDCWVWGNTAVSEIALNVQHGISQRLSVQLFDSCYSNGCQYACCGGNPSIFADYYNTTKKYMVPWTNTNANFVDADLRGCDPSSVLCSSIGNSPFVTVTSMTASVIPTTNLTPAEAIANIKNILLQNKAVTYSQHLPTQAAAGDFHDFWKNSDESAMFDPTQFSGQTWDNGGGHDEIIVGYDDTDPNNSYWIILNSWGAPSNRPNAVWHLPMNANYDGYYLENNTQHPIMQFWSVDPVFDIPAASGSLGVTISPDAVALDGAKWRVDNGEWQNSGASLAGLAVGAHTVSFSDITGYVAPADQIVVVADGASAQATGTYAPKVGGGANLLPLNITASLNVPGLAGGFVEEFASLANWSANALASWTVSNGQASVTGTSSDKYYNIAYTPKTFAELDYSVRLKRTGGCADANAIYFRGTAAPQDSYGRWYAGYWFAYANNGTFKVAKAQGGAWSTIAQWTKSPAILPYDWNVLRVTAVGSTLRFFINGTEVHTATDSALASGQVGIEMQDGGSGGYPGSGGTAGGGSGTLSVDAAFLSTVAN